MSIARTVRLVILSLILLPSLAMADKAADIKQLLDQSGFSAQVQSLPALIRTEIRYSGEITDDNLDLILGRTDSQALPTQVETAVEKHLFHALGSKDIATLHKWYQSDIGQRITREEVQAGDSSQMEAMLTQKESLLADPKRVKRIQMLDQLTGTTDTALALHRYSSSAVKQALQQALSAQTSDNTKDVNSPAIAEPADTRAAIEQRVTLAFLYAYRNLDDDTLSRYEAHLKSPAARHFNNALHGGLSTGVRTIIDNWADELAAALTETSN
ncbi:MAG: hypothetical protein R3292_14405 [Alcanivorax sp.]|nr:hypothetical protein [Alcanivorax sp.]